MVAIFTTGTPAHLRAPNSELRTPNSELRIPDRFMVAPRVTIVNHRNFYSLNNKKRNSDIMKLGTIKKHSLIAIALVTLASCAQQPAAITPVSMGDAYSNVSCSRAKQLYKDEAAKVPTLVAAQKQAVTGDAVGVFLIGVPVSSLSGADLEGEIATTKGKLIALGARLEACGTSPAQVAWG